MKKISPLFIATMLFMACTSTGPLNTHALKPVTEKPKDREIVGYWRTQNADAANNKELYTKDIPDSRIWFHNDGTFEGIDFPDLSTLTANTGVGAVTGTWKVASKDEQWELFIHFNKGGVINEELSTYFEMSQNKKDLVLVESLGDPVAGKKMLFEKVRVGHR